MDLAEKLFRELLIKETNSLKRDLFELYFQKYGLEKSRLSHLVNIFELKFHKERIKRRIPYYEAEVQKMKKKLGEKSKKNPIDDSDIEQEMEEEKIFGLQRYDRTYDFTSMNEEIRVSQKILKTIKEELTKCNQTIDKIEKMLLEEQIKSCGQKIESII